MPEPRHLERAPIREAAIDIRVTPIPPASGLDTLKSLAEAMQYPTVRAALEFGAGFSVEPDGAVRQGHEIRPSGFLAVSEAEAQVVQFRLNGLSLSHLAPYRSWNELREQASLVWDRFRERMRPAHATRLALRYINHIRVPYPVTDLGRYFRGLPENPDEWPEATSSFLFRQTLHDDGTGAVVNVMHALADDVDEDRIGVIFDIEAYLDGSFETDDASIWGPFSDLRDLKNRIFFAGITESTLSLFE